MSRPSAASRRIVVVGGGIAGLAAAARLAQAGLPVTLLEESQLGIAASTRNQGWLRSGALWAIDAPDYARLCNNSLEQTLAFCPECLEPQVEPMAFLFSRPETLVARWKDAWHATGTPTTELPLDHVFAALPGLQKQRVQHAFRVPDRAIRLEVLLQHLAAAAQNAGAEVRTATPVKSLRREGDRIAGVVTAEGEDISARLVILAGGSSGMTLCEEFLDRRPGNQLDFELVPLKAHLLSHQPQFGPLPFCIPDADGFNHIPHPPSSVFGTGEWERLLRPDDRPDPAQIELLSAKIHEFFPATSGNSREIHAWAGTMVQALSLSEIVPGRAVWPIVIDHQRYAPHIANLFSIFPGRATLWAHLAEETRRAVLARLEVTTADTARPPWSR